MPGDDQSLEDLIAQLRTLAAAPTPDEGPPQETEQIPVAKTHHTDEAARMYYLYNIMRAMMDTWDKSATMPFFMGWSAESIHGGAMPKNFPYGVD